MKFVKEMDIKKKGILDKVCYYACRADNEDYIQDVNLALIDKYKASDFQVMKISEALDESTGELVDDAYLVVFHVSIFKYKILFNTFDVLDIKFGDAWKLAKD